MMSITIDGYKVMTAPELPKTVILRIELIVSDSKTEQSGALDMQLDPAQVMRLSKALMDALGSVNKIMV